MRANGERHDMVRGEDAGKPIVRDLSYIRDRIVNVFFYGEPRAGDRNWVLVDAGLYGSAGRIERVAAERFGEGARPAAIVLTHGHFDHVGALRTLCEKWDVPVYAHELEIPYITGRSAYPPPDPTVGGGAMARMAALYPKRPIDIGHRALALPDDRTVPGMPGWRWLPTPGHSPGHVSFFRDSDQLLIAGDAFVTTKQESAMAVMTQRLEIHGPPMYFTPDWGAARDSVERLAALAPVIAATGHGRPWSGPQMLNELQYLSRNFEELAMPRHGRYVNQPAITNADGVVSLPPRVKDPVTQLLAAAAIVAVAGVAASAMRRDNRSG